MTDFQSEKLENDDLTSRKRLRGMLLGSIFLFLNIAEKTGY